MVVSTTSRPSAALNQVQRLDHLQAPNARDTLGIVHMVATSSGRMQRLLVVSLAATFCYVVATLYFGLRAHSLALISEAGCPSLALGVS